MEELFFNKIFNIFDTNFSYNSMVDKLCFRGIVDIWPNGMETRRDQVTPKETVKNVNLY